MNKSKKTILIVLCVIALTAVTSVVCIGLRVVPTIDQALHISQLLQPVIEANNLSMHISVSVEVNSNTVALDSDVYLVTEEDSRFLAMEQKGITLYIADNVLFLENGKAFRIGDNMQMQTASFVNLLPQIGAMYDVLKITAEETGDSTVSEITVTGDQVDTLLAAASLGDTLPVDGIEKLNLYLTERNGKLNQISFSGKGELDETSVMLHVTLSGFRILASGDYPIPKNVKQSAATVDPEMLFSLTEDLYRLVFALVPYADMESIDGTLELTVDCGLLQVDTDMKLSDLKTTSGSQLNPEKLQKLPEMLGWLCVEGDISCTQQGNAYFYALELDLQAMQQLSQMILPELAQYGSNLTEGSVTVTLENNAVASMTVSIKGKISALITKIPISVGAEFTFY